MKKYLVAILFIAAAALIYSPAPAQNLGDAAPALQIAEWAKGGPVDLAAGKGKTVYVVEFWATWCGPCRQTIPHLSEVQAKYKDRGVVVVGVSNEDAATVKPFVEQKGDTMDYNVAVDDNNKTSKAYMGAYGVKGIPHAFVVDKTGAIVWHGHPMDGLEDVLDKVLAGTFDMKQQEVMAEMRELLPLWGQEYLVLSKYGRDTKEADAVGQKFLKHGALAPEMLNQLAWVILTQDGFKYRNLPFALEVSKAAYDATGGQDAAIVDTYARALFDNGKVREAVEMQKQAVELSKDSPDLLKDLQDTLERYQSKLGTQI